MSAIRGVGARLSLALSLVVAVALGVVYLIVVPRLERNLVDAKLDQLSRTSAVVASRFPYLSIGGFGGEAVLDAYLREAEDATNARVALYHPLAAREQRGRDADVADDEIGLEAALTYAPARGTVERDGLRLAEVAYPVPDDTGRTAVLLFSASLDDTLANVKLVSRRLLVAGAGGVLVALALGFGGASLFARRLRRLERAAERIAGGELDEPVVDHGRDEVGELARAFERMRGRLAQLEHARREFIANASHELRTPIFSLGGFLELLADEELDEQTRREFLVTMQEQVERLTRLATDLLDLSRLDAGRLHVERERVDLERVAEVLVEEFAALARTTAHDLAVEDGAAAAALADEQRALQIGRILVENALCHTPAGTPIRLRVAREQGSAVLAVEDEGPGITAEHLPHVFDRFYRVDGGRASGSGLGLAIARELAQLMGGTLEVASSRGGTSFRVILPAATARPVAEHALA